MNLLALRRLIRKNDKKQVDVPEWLLALDPGHTTGWALFHKGEIHSWGEAKNITGKIPNLVYHFEELRKLFYLVPKNDGLEIVCEEYSIYDHKLEAHSRSKVPTLRIIGIIQFISWLEQYPLQFYNASTAKGFCTDAKLKEWGLHREGQRHARDAIRHACYYILFYGR